MVRRVSAAKAKAELSSLSAEVAYGGQHIIIEKRGVPLVALVSITDFELLEQDKATSSRPLGALALVGAWSEIEDSVVDSLIEDIYTAREADSARPVQLEL